MQAYSSSTTAAPFLLAWNNVTDVVTSTVAAAATATVTSSSSSTTRNVVVDDLSIDDKLLIVHIRLIIYAYLVMPIAIGGIALNGFTCVVLLHPKMRYFSTNAYLTALSISNIVCLINFLFLYSFRYMLSNEMFKRNVINSHHQQQHQPHMASNGTNATLVSSMQQQQQQQQQQTNDASDDAMRMYENVVNLLYGCWTPIFTTFQVFAIYLTCAVTIDRWFYVAMPLRVDTICSMKNTLRTIGGLFAFCVVYNLPKWFEIESVAVPIASTASTSTSTTTTSSSKNASTSNASESQQAPSRYYYQARFTEFGKNPMYNAIMHTYGYVIFVYGIPFLVLLIVNIGIIQKLVESSERKRRLLANSSSNSKSNNNLNRQSVSAKSAAASASKALLNSVATSASSSSPQHNATATPAATGGSVKLLDTRLTFIVLSVVLAFFCSQFPNLIIWKLAASHSNKLWFHIAKACCDLLLVTNYCVNFLIYCFFGHNFRTIAHTILLKPSCSPYKRQITAVQYHAATATATAATPSLAAIAGAKPAFSVNANANASRKTSAPIGTNAALSTSPPLLLNHHHNNSNNNNNSRKSNDFDQCQQDDVMLTRRSTMPTTKDYGEAEEAARLTKGEPLQQQSTVLTPLLDTATS